MDQTLRQTLRDLQARRATLTALPTLSMLDEVLLAEIDREEGLTLRALAYGQALAGRPAPKPITARERRW